MDIRATIIKLIKENVPIQNTWVTVTSVDWEAKTMDCIGISDDLEYYDVLLGIGSTYTKPVKDTKCLIGTIENKEASSFLIFEEEIEEYLIEDKSGFKWLLKDGNLTINGDNFGSIIKIEEIVKKLNAVENAVNQLKGDLNSHTHIVPQAPSGSTSSAPPTVPSTVNLNNTQVSEIENDKIKHGG